MSTPRTDTIAHFGHHPGAYIAKMTDFARQLEQELAAERALADLLANAVIDLRTLLKAYGRGDDTGLFALESWKEAR